MRIIKSLELDQYDVLELHEFMNKVKASTIKAVLKGRNWKHVTTETR